MSLASNIKITDLDFSYKNKPILSNLNLNLCSGVYHLIGPNGSGKSTLLNLIYYTFFKKLDTENSFANFIKSQNIKFYHIKNSYFCNQNSLSSLLNWYTVEYNFSLYLKWSKSEIDLEKRLEALKFAMFRIPLKQRVSTLPGGQKQIVAVFKSLLVPVNLLLLDEPFNHIDYQNQLLLVEILKNFIKINTDTILIYTNHNLDIKNIVKNEKKISL